MNDLHITKPRGMNGSKKANHPKAPSHKGMITDGASLETGYKVVKVTESSPQAVPQNTGKGRGS